MVCSRDLLTADLIYGLKRALDENESSASSVLCNPGVSHLASGFRTFGWGCGYLNAQMLLSHIMRSSPQEYNRAFGEGLPSIRKLQNLIEQGWAKGSRLYLELKRPRD